MVPRLLALLLLFPAALHAQPGNPLDQTVSEAEITGETVRFKIDLAGARNNVQLARLSDGQLVYVVRSEGQDHWYTPDAFAEMFYDQRRSNGLLSLLFNITSPAGLIWIGLGLGGQLLFTGRMLIQWLTSEKNRRSVIPVSFWWMSLAGATMLLAYFIWRRDIVGILGQATGWMIYLRNLILIRRSRI